MGWIEYFVMYISINNHSLRDCVRVHRIKYGWHRVWRDDQQNAQQQQQRLWVLYIEENIASSRLKKKKENKCTTFFFFSLKEKKSFHLLYRRWPAIRENKKQNKGHVYKNLSFFGNSISINAQSSMHHINKNIPPQKR